MITVVLTAAQLIVLRGLAGGLKNCQIADTFPRDKEIGADGVDYHRRRLYLSLKVHTDKEAVARGKDLGLI